MKRLKVAQIGLNFHWEIIWDFHLQSGKGYGSFSTKELLHHWKAIYHARCRLGSQFLNRSAIASLKSHWSYTRCRWDSFSTEVLLHHITEKAIDHTRCWLNSILNEKPFTIPDADWTHNFSTEVLLHHWKTSYHTRCWLDSHLQPAIYYIADGRMSPLTLIWMQVPMLTLDWIQRGRIWKTTVFRTSSQQ